MPPFHPLLRYFDNTLHDQAAVIINLKYYHYLYITQPMRILFTGDVMLGRLVDQLMPTHNNNTKEDKEDRDHAWNILKLRNPEKLVGTHAP